MYLRDNYLTKEHRNSQKVTNGSSTQQENPTSAGRLQLAPKQIVIVNDNGRLTKTQKTYKCTKI